MKTVTVLIEPVSTITCTVSYWDKAPKILLNNIKLFHFRLVPRLTVGTHGGRLFRPHLSPGRKSAMRSYRLLVSLRIVKKNHRQWNIAPCDIFLDNDNQHSVYVPLAS
jgi:hypothetical protein